MSAASRSASGVAELIYDADCGFCDRSVGWMRRLGATATFVGHRDVDLASRGLAPADLEAAAFFYDGTRLLRGHHAIAAALRTSRKRVPRLAGRVIHRAPVSWIAAVVYRLVARNRYRLPGASGSCLRARG